MMHDDGPEWFTAKRYGLGAGLPCAWQGWALLLGYIALLVAAAFLFAERQPLVFFAIILPLTLMVILIASRTTRGGWRWRWGKDKDTW